MALDGRLKVIAENIRKGDRVADIGTDHAYLPVFLRKNGFSRYCYACDIGEGPLENARSHVEASGIDGIELRLGDGLSAVNADEVDTVVIAGMGGDLIADIISAAPWIKNGRFELLLQPMTSAEDLRRYLCQSGFKIVKERAALSKGRVYTVIKAVYNGSAFDCDPLFYELGRLAEKPGTAEMVYIKRRWRIIAKLADDIKAIPSEKDRYDMLVAVLSKIDRIIERYGN